ncbi:GNAT family N-acetyltransferase [Falsochrobactrum ovis]|uniref:L-ornithine N(alpha)-acyltransferase n=1 Tax=Falsochrobactrum ovis TaxID=1293442 RepID=A0A364JZ74_9HYPH|nr:GNAT family N-acetyltransferase [Falsochrobactrum ovis]RAK34045.1 ornithine-acyl[acyl carrier protein] N-acyltransferase [Falsochrobactrum ovis]
MTVVLGRSQQINHDKIMSGIETETKLQPISPPSNILGRIGSLEVRLANSRDAIEAAQELRFRVFFEEMGARKENIEEVELRDADRFDTACDHLLVYDTSLPLPEHKQIVGTYRLMRSEQAEKTKGFYSADEFDIQKLIDTRPGINPLELGRSCVQAEYRSKRTVELLWQGAWAYCRRYSIDVMFGCASFHGPVPAAHALGLSFLHNHCRATPDWDVSALPHRYQTMDMMPVEAINNKVALFSMPPLIKGYLRLGAMIGDGAVIDEAFGTTDVFIILPIERISSRYITYYGAEADRFV